MKLIETIYSAILNSYSQLFFSKNKWFAIFLALSTFINWKIGIAGFICLVSAILSAIALGYKSQFIKDGTYTFNSLMTGMALAIYFEMNLSFVFLLLICGVLSLFISLWLLNWTSRRTLPLLSWTFIIVTWIAVLGASNFTSFQFIRLDAVKLSNSPLSGIIGSIDGWLNQQSIPGLVKIYFRSLGAIMFQYNTLAGVLIFIGLFIYSRIATLLSIIGFFIGFLFYNQFEGDFTQLIFSYIGFNFILTAIALGGFFIVPSWKSFLLVVLTIPIIALLISALSRFFTPFGLPIFSLPFCIMVTLVLIALSLREKVKNLIVVVHQQFSPEENHYKTELTAARFGHHTYFHLGLPVIGEWNISQGYDGDITHIGEWKHALDFDVRNPDNSTYKNSGSTLKDFNCYELPIIAPAAGYVVKVLNEIHENQVGEVNLDQNWGNTIIIKHEEGFYSKLSHLKIDTIKVKEGDYVNKGDVLAKLGNSGRSPEPHLHFQLQATPFIGSKTLPHPISYYLKENNGAYELKQFEIPKEGEKIRNITTSTTLTKALGFIPGQSLNWSFNNTKIEWNIHTDAYNKTYIHCKNTNAIAYFINNKNVFYFTDYFGDKNSALFDFYLGLQNTLLGVYDNVTVKDRIHLKFVTNKTTKFLHDIIAPFGHLLKGVYTSNLKAIDNSLTPNHIILSSTGQLKSLKKEQTLYQFECEFKNNKIVQFSIQRKGIQKLFICTD